MRFAKSICAFCASLWQLWFCFLAALLDSFQPLHVNAVVSLQVFASSLEHQRFGNQLVQGFLDDGRSRLDFLFRQPPFSDSRESILSIGMLEQVVENRLRDMRSPHLIH